MILLKPSFINYLLSACHMASDSKLAYETILKYSDKNFYPNRNYLKNQNIINTKNIIIDGKEERMLNDKYENLNQQKVPQKVSSNVTKNNFINTSIQNDLNSFNDNNIEYLRLSRHLLHHNSYHIALTSCSKSGDVLTAYKIIDIMIENNILIRIDSFNALLDTVSLFTFVFFCHMFARLILDRSSFFVCLLVYLFIHSFICFF